MSEITPTKTKRTFLESLRLVVHQVRYEQRAFWVNRFEAMFTVGFSVLFLVMLGASSKNSRISYLHHIKLVQYYTQGFVAYGVMSACFTTLAVNLVVRRETGLLKRLRLSPLPAWSLLVSIFLSTMIVALVQVVLLLLLGRYAYGVHPPHSWLAFVGTLLVGVVCFTALGVAMSTLISNRETAGPATSIVFFVLLFLSGLFFPLAPGSGLAKFSNYFPIRHFIFAISAPFALQRGASPWAGGDLVVLALWAIGGIIVSLSKFRWAPRRR